jgi:CRP-like cAMP-binding protein
MRATYPTNHLLDLMEPHQGDVFAEDLQSMDIGPRDSLSMSGGALKRVYFPTGAVISVLCHSGRDTMDVRGVGREGMLGSEGLAAAERRFEIVCQIGGTMLHMGIAAFKRHAKQSIGLQSLMSMYSAGVMTTTTQSVACNALHTIGQQCARWLLVTHDRVGQVDFTLTHALLARMVGARRPGVSIAVSAFQRAGLIRYRLGRVGIIDRAGLESQSCDCYRAVVSETERLFSKPENRRLKRKAAVT